MLYLSQLLGAPVEDVHGARIGKLIDITVPAAQIGRPEPAYPNALLVEGEEEQSWRVPPEAVEWHENALRLRVPVEQLPVQQDGASPSEVRLNDICLANDWRIQGIDNSTLGLVRRLAPNWLLGAKSRHTPTNLISWDHIELIGTQQQEEQEAPEMIPQPPRHVSGQLAELRPADIAEIVHQLTPAQGARLIEGLDNETAADTMQEIDTERQRNILENLQPERAADILQAMEPDEAADLLAQLPEERAQELLGLMTPEESEEVQELLEYEEDTAGGLMTTDYIGLNTTRKVADALDAVRAYMQEQEIRAAYVYCVADEKADESSLLGVVSIWDLLVATPSQPLQELMKTDLITVQPDTDRLTVAQVIAKYNLLYREPISIWL